MKILGIETSCDETAVALIEGKNGRVRELESLVASQIDIHAATGGVVPEVAAREHVSAIIPLVSTLLGKWNKKPKIDAIAVTSGPGLFSSLMVGVETAKALAFAWDVPLVAVNHIEGHLYSSSINSDASIKFPALALIVSGGHTELILMKGHGSYHLIGRTKDDAAGECFDKTAQMMGLGYPGGPAISKDALKGDPASFALPRPMLKEKNFDFSFSGLKTAVLYTIRNLKLNIDDPKVVADLAASTQAAIVEVLVEKTIRAARKLKVKTLIVGGGVAANDALRAELAARSKNELSGVELRMPQKRYTTDNAVMIAAAGYFHAIKRDFVSPLKIKADPNWELV
jgi:N6-L-threonylcarbamoyladenine synthase